MEVFGIGLSHRGMVRPNNEDSYFISNGRIGSLANLYIVADGIGGSRAGEIASEKAINFFCDCIESSSEEDAEALFRRALEYANAGVARLSSESAALSGMGTTFTAATVNNGRLTFIHIGDSRLYLIKDGAVSQLSVDHTLANEMIIRGLAEEDEILAMDNKNVLMRWIGSDEAPEPLVKTVDWGENCAALLCSDGLSNMLAGDTILEVMASGAGKEEKAGRLVETANARGGFDNITVILL